MTSWKLHWHTHDCIRRNVSPMMTYGTDPVRVRLANQRARLAHRRSVRVHGWCPTIHVADWQEFRDEVSAMVTQLGLPASPNADLGDALWCLGGRDVLAAPPPDAVDLDDCVDLTIYACAEHRVAEVTIAGHHLGDWLASIDESSEERAAALPIGESWGEASERLGQHLGEMFQEVLVARPAQ